MKPDLRQRLAQIPWAEYETAYGNAAGEHCFETKSGKRTERWGPVPEQLLALASGDRSTAMAASHHLWCCLCHQHAYVSSAALPALPFLLEILDEANEQVAVEILDIVTGLAVCSREDTPAREAWTDELRAKLVAEGPRFLRLAKHRNAEISEWGNLLLAELGLMT